MWYSVIIHPSSWTNKDIAWLGRWSATIIQRSTQHCDTKIRVGSFGCHLVSLKCLAKVVSALVTNTPILPTSNSFISRWLVMVVELLNQLWLFQVPFFTSLLYALWGPLGILKFMKALRCTKKNESLGVLMVGLEKD